MKNRRIFLVIALLIAATGLLFAQSDREREVVSETVRYSVDGQDLVGFLAYDRASTARRPGVIVVHEWQGINDYARTRATDLAEEGYVALALDMYGDGIEVPISEARTMSRRVGSDFALIEARFNAALEVLRDSPYVDASNIAAIGYCFGGGIVLNMARMGTEIDGVVSFHGSLNTGLTADAGDIKTQILAIQGDADPVAPLERQNAFKEEMASAGADLAYIIFGNLPAHNFTNPRGSSYFEAEANLAWAAMLSFFDSIFE